MTKIQMIETKKTILIICDGMGDIPVAELGGNTPLEAAVTPNMDKLAAGGVTGVMDVLGEGKRPNSDEAHLTLFGYDLAADYPGRGPIEAAGAGINLQQGDVAIRANLATVDDGLRVIDRRCGRIETTTEFVSELDGMEISGVKFLVKPGTGHRVILVMRGAGLSDKITNSDVHYVTEDRVIEDWVNLPVNKITALDDTPEAAKTAEVLQRFLDQAHRLLEINPLNKKREEDGLPKGNYLLTRGPGYYRQLTTFEHKWGTKAACIAGAGLYKGLGMMTGMTVIPVAGATGLPDTNVRAKIEKAVEIFPDYDFIYLHIKPTDIFGENGDCLGKRDFIEKIDQALVGLDSCGAKVVITADHSTPCAHKDHSGDPVPVLVYLGKETKELIKFGESTAAKGNLGRIEGKDFMRMVLA